MSVSFYGFVDALGTVGLTANLTRAAGALPAVDFTTMTQARFKVVDAAGTSVYWSASIASDPAATATTISIRYVLQPGDLALTTYRAWGQVSADGVAWYTQRVPETITVTAPLAE